MKLKGGLKISLIGGIVLFALFIGGPALAADYTLSGTITTAVDGEPVEAMYVYIYESATGAFTDYAYTDATGAYTMTIAEGDYYIYNLTYDTNDANIYYLKITEDVSLTANTTVDFALTRRARVTGQVLDSSGDPIYDATVYAYLDGTSNGYDSATSTTTGVFYLSPYKSDSAESAAGNYYIYAYKAGYFGTRVLNVELVDNETASQDITLVAGSTVSGTITDADGDPIDDLTLTLDNDSTSDIYYNTSDSNGEFTISVYELYDYNSTAVGDYTLTVTGDDYVSQKMDVKITADESTLTDYDFTLAASGKIRGHVYASDGETPIEGVTITADDGYGNTYTDTTSDTGAYTVTSLTGSTNYTVTASKTGYVTKKKYNIEVTTGETTTEQDFNLSAALTFSGTIKLANGTAIEDATISLYQLGKARSSTADYSGTSCSDGSFSIGSIVPASYRIKISGTGYITKKIARLKIKSDRTKNYTLSKAGSIYGRLTNSGQAVKGATITVYGVGLDADKAYSSTTSDNRGYYRLGSLKKGTYRIKITSTDYATTILTKKVKAGEQKTVNASLEKAGAIEGYVYDASTHLPLSGYYVKIRGQAMSAYTDANGYYIIDGLAPGKYKLFIGSVLYKTEFYNDQDQASAANTVSVTASKTTENINFYLENI